MADTTELVGVARASVRARRWDEARRALREAEAIAPLEPDDLFTLADCAWWLGDVDDALATYERAHRAYLADDRPADAALAALMLGAHASERGDHVIGTAWMRRATGLLDATPETAAHGYPLYFEVFRLLGSGDTGAARAAAVRMRELGRRHADPELVALGTLGEGRVLLTEGDATGGLALLDEAMLAAVADDLRPVWTGGIYCHIMDVCHQLVDVRRAAEWTRATEAWCERAADAVLFRGICRVHRAQVYRRRGDWQQAEVQASIARDELRDVHVGTVAEASYELGELALLRGAFDEAADRFRRADELGRDPQPGLALLHLARGRTDQAHASVTAALVGRDGDRLGRVPLLAAAVDIGVRGGDLDLPRRACQELEATAEVYATEGLLAIADQARGAVLVAVSQHDVAVEPLRRACATWQRVRAPYEAARVRALLAEAYRALDDEPRAAVELDAARVAFAELGAQPDLARLDGHRSSAPPPDGLSPRKVEVLQQVATGRTNREVARELVISEATVARHLANLYRKLGVSSRAAATAYAFERGLAGSPAAQDGVAGPRRLHGPGEVGARVVP